MATYEAGPLTTVMQAGIDQRNAILDLATPLPVTNEDGDPIYHRFKIDIQNSFGLLKRREAPITATGLLSSMIMPAAVLSRATSSFVSSSTPCPPPTTAGSRHARRKSRRIILEFWVLGVGSSRRKSGALAASRIFRGEASD